MAVMLALVLGCKPPASIPLDAATVGLDVVAGRMAELAPVDCQVLALRAHREVLVLEAAAASDDVPSLLPRYRLHALAAQLGECAGLDRPPFYGEVGEQVVDLHDLRSAQLQAIAPGLAGMDGGPAVAARAENVRVYLDLVRADPRFADADRVLGLLREQ